MTQLVFFWLGNMCLYLNSKTIEKDKMIAFELEELSYYCKKEDEQCEKPRNERSLITSYYKLFKLLNERFNNIPTRVLSIYD